jgi:hypothetical protein
MSDRELLTLAAKAAGYEVKLDHQGIFHIHEGTGPQSWRPWNPRDDDGDALRLAVKLGLTVAQLMTSREVLVNDYDETVLVSEFHEADPLAATRRAITRAAAEIGRSMK